MLIGPALAPPLVSPFTTGKQYKGVLGPLRLALDAIKAFLGLITIRAALGIFSAARYISRVIRNFTPQDGPAAGQAANEGPASTNGIISRVPRRVGATLSTLAILGYARLCLLVLYLGGNLHRGWTGAQGIRTAAWAAGLRSGIGRWMVWGTT